MNGEITSAIFCKFTLQVLIAPARVIINLKQLLNNSGRNQFRCVSSYINFFAPVYC